MSSGTVGVLRAQGSALSGIVPWATPSHHSQGDLVTLLGPPGAGKGTVAQQLADTYQIELAVMGEYFRTLATYGRAAVSQISHTVQTIIEAFARANQALVAEMQPLLLAGKLVPDGPTIALATDILERTKENSVRLLDGYPRSEAQGRSLIDYTARNNLRLHVVYLVAETREAIDALVARLMARGRPDDTPETIETRINIYLEETLPVVRLLRNSGCCFHEVNAIQAREAVAAEIVPIVEHVLRSGWSTA